MADCYLGAPMRGLPGNNHDAINDAAAWLDKWKGWSVANPAAHEEDWCGVDKSTEHLDELMWWDLDQLIAAKNVVFLEGWEKSEGCNIERDLAHMLGKEVWFLVEDYIGGRQLKKDAVGDPRFHQLLTEIGTLHDKKQQDYGSEADAFANVRAAEDFGVEPWIGALMRMNDKMVRLQHYAQKRVLENESAEDSFMDIAVYALIALVLYREASEK